MQTISNTEAKLNLQSLFTVAPTGAASSKLAPSNKAIGNITAYNAAASSIYQVPHHQKVVMSASATPAQGLSTNSTPLYSGTQQYHRITTDDLLDMQFPLKSLTTGEIQNAYRTKMGGKTHHFDFNKQAPMKQGIDIDSLLDAKMNLQQGFTMPNNVIVSEVNYKNASAEAKERLMSGVKQNAGFSQTVPQQKVAASSGAFSVQASMQGKKPNLAGQSRSNITMNMQSEVQFTIDKHEPIVQRDLEFGSYEI